MPFGLLAFSRGHFKNSSCEIQPEETENPTPRMYPGSGDTWQTGSCHSSLLTQPTRADFPCGTSADNPGIAEHFPGELLILPAPQPEQSGSLWPASIAALPLKTAVIYRHRVSEHLRQQRRAAPCRLILGCLAGARSPRWEMNPSCIPHHARCLLRTKRCLQGFGLRCSQPSPAMAWQRWELLGRDRLVQRCSELAPLADVCLLPRGMSGFQQRWQTLRCHQEATRHRSSCFVLSSGGNPTAVPGLTYGPPRQRDVGENRAGPT